MFFLHISAWKLDSIMNWHSWYLWCKTEQWWWMCGAGMLVVSALYTFQLCSYMEAFDWIGYLKQESRIMKKIIVIGDSNQTNLITVKLAFLLSCPVYSGEKEKANRAYCSSMDWPNSIFPNSSMELRVPKVCQKYQADQDTTLGKILKFGPSSLSLSNSFVRLLFPSFYLHIFF